LEKFNVAVIPGDGIGGEVTAEAIKALEAAADLHGGLSFSFTSFPWSCTYYLEHGRMMPPDGLQILQGFDAILLGAVGAPGLVEDHVSVWGLIMPIRRGFDQYINLRPARLLQGIKCPLADKQPGDFDFVVIRENTEGEYSNVGGRMYSGTPNEIVIQNSIFSRKGTERVIRYAFQLAERFPRRRLVGATKSNGITYAMPFWDEVFKEVAREFPGVEASLTHIDALSAFFVLKPEAFDVVVASNLFGDILTDLAAAIGGSIGIAPSANINPEGRYPSLFEPIHGSAPDIAGKGIANPIGAIWTTQLMLNHLGYPELGKTVFAAIEETLLAGVKTPDLGGKATTVEMGSHIAKLIREAK